MMGLRLMCSRDAHEAGITLLPSDETEYLAEPNNELLLPTTLNRFSCPDPKKFNTDTKLDPLKVTKKTPQGLNASYILQAFLVKIGFSLVTPGIFLGVWFGILPAVGIVTAAILPASIAGILTVGLFFLSLCFFKLRHAESFIKKFSTAAKSDQNRETEATEHATITTLDDDTDLEPILKICADNAITIAAHKRKLGDISQNLANELRPVTIFIVTALTTKALQNTYDALTPHQRNNIVKETYKKLGLIYKKDTNTIELDLTRWKPIFGLALEKINPKRAAKIAAQPAAQPQPTAWTQNKTAIVLYLTALGFVVISLAILLSGPAFLPPALAALSLVQILLYHATGLPIIALIVNFAKPWHSPKDSWAYKVEAATRAQAPAAQQAKAAAKVEATQVTETERLKAVPDLSGHSKEAAQQAQPGTSREAIAMALVKRAMHRATPAEAKAKTSKDKAAAEVLTVQGMFKPSQNPRTTIVTDAARRTVTTIIRPAATPGYNTTVTITPALKKNALTAAGTPPQDHRSQQTIQELTPDEATDPRSPDPDLLTKELTALPPSLPGKPGRKSSGADSGNGSITPTTALDTLRANALLQEPEARHLNKSLASATKWSGSGNAYRGAPDETEIQKNAQQPTRPQSAPPDIRAGRCSPIRSAQSPPPLAAQSLTVRS